MNRIIIIGNGFDLAHGLKTGYKDFIDGYWKNFTKEFTRYRIFPYNDEFIKFEWTNGDEFYILQCMDPNCFFRVALDIESYGELKQLIADANNASDVQFSLSFNNNFFGYISNQCSLTNWVDVENEYYDALKKLLSEEDSVIRNEKVKKLNNEFNAVKKLLEEYLTEICEQDVKVHESIKDAITQPLKNNEIANSKKEISIRDVCAASLSGAYHPDKMVKQRAKDSEAWLNNIRIKKTIFLNFNYTNTVEKLYVKPIDSIINIHGELNNNSNPIIFGYGDELDDDYKKIEKLQDNDFLENIKSIQYHKTRNYRELLNVIESEPYQVFIMGHSCGNSDRTLLNTLFEHENCISVKVFYRQFENGSDDYSNLIRNISRNFNNKPQMRDIVVNREDCSPLVPVSKNNL